MPRKLETQIQEYLDYCKNIQRLTPASIETRKWVYQDFLQRMPHVKKLENLTTQDVISYITTFVERGCAGRTVNSRLSELLSMIRYHLEMGVPMPHLKLRMIQKARTEPPRRNFFTAEQINQALQYANQMEWLLIKLAFDCGLRLSELTNLHLMNLDGQVVRVVGKGRKFGEMRMTAETRARLDEWIQARQITDWLWPSPRRAGQPLEKHAVYRHLCKPFRRAGFEDFYPHALRHSFATDKQNKGASPLELQLLLRHSSVNTSMQYLHGLDGKVQEVFRKYEGARPGGVDRTPVYLRFMTSERDLQTEEIKSARTFYEFLNKF